MDQAQPQGESSGQQTEMKEAIQSMHQIESQLKTLNEHKFIRLYNSTSGLLWFQLFRGIAFGLGSVLGATLVVSVLAYLLSQMEFIPIIGEWTKQIIAEIKQ